MNNFEDTRRATERDMVKSAAALAAAEDADLLRAVTELVHRGFCGTILLDKDLLGYHAEVAEFIIDRLKRS